MKRFKNVFRAARLSVLASATLALGLGAGCAFAPLADAEVERVGRIDAEIAEAMDQAQSPADGLTLDVAIRYALQHNLSIRAAELEYAVAIDAKTGAALRMLPSLQANLGVRARSKYDASTSERLSDGARYLEPSFSSEKVGYPTDLTAVWSILDFGLSHLRSRQTAERERISEQNLRRLRQQIAMDVCVAYFRLLAAEDILRECASLEEAIRVQLAVFEDEAAKRNLSESERARRSLPLLTGIKNLRDLSRERDDALSALARAMGAPRARDLRVASAQGWADALPAIPDPEKAPLFYERALTHRPEMYKADSEERITGLDAKAALLQLAPNVNLSASLVHDSDKFLVYHNWMEAGMRLSWDLLRLPAKLADVENAKLRVELAEMRRRLAAASILVQVNLALVELDGVAERMELFDEIEVNRRTVLRGLEESVASGKAHGADILAERLRHVGDFANRCWVRAEYMAAYARLVSALGVDPEAGPASSGNAAPFDGFLLAVATMDSAGPDSAELAALSGADPAGKAAAPGTKTAEAATAFASPWAGDRTGPSPVELESLAAMPGPAGGAAGDSGGAMRSPWGGVRGGPAVGADGKALEPVLLSGRHSGGYVMSEDSSGGGLRSPWSKAIVIPPVDEAAMPRMPVPPPAVAVDARVEPFMSMAPGEAGRSPGFNGVVVAAPAEARPEPPSFASATSGAPALPFAGDVDEYASALSAGEELLYALEPILDIDAAALPGSPSAFDAETSPEDKYAALTFMEPEVEPHAPPIPEPEAGEAAKADPPTAPYREIPAVTEAVGDGEDSPSELVEERPAEASASAEAAGSAAVPAAGHQHAHRQPEQAPGSRTGLIRQWFSKRR